MTADGENLPGMIGHHPAMREVYRRVRSTAGSDLSVLIVGETGTGKELVATAYHQLRRGSSRPLVALNCAALTETLVEAELFGAERGSFTGADRRLVGVLEQAQGGTLFLDELCSMAAWAQAHLLRGIEDRRFRRIGGTGIVEADFRVIAAVADAPSRLLSAGRLRADLFYRVAEVIIELPPLRTRRSDIPLLAEAFLESALAPGAPRRGFAAEAMTLLEGHSWPGNVRELRSLVRRLTQLVTSPVIQYEHVLAELRSAGCANGRHDDLADVIQRCGSQRAAARELGVSLTTLRRRLGRPPRM